jgi:hypothetical protein
MGISRVENMRKSSSSLGDQHLRADADADREIIDSLMQLRKTSGFLRARDCAAFDTIAAPCLVGDTQKFLRAVRRLLNHLKVSVR